LSVPTSGVKTIYELLEYSAKKFPNNNCVGSRPLIKIHNEEKEIVKNVGGIISKFFHSLALFIGIPVKEKRTWTFYESGPYQWTSFADFRKNVLALGSSLVSKVGLRPKDRLGIFANTCPEWFLTHHAAASQTIAVVTVYANLGTVSTRDLSHFTRRGRSRTCNQ
jgi:long-chain acyl-CoA synthetase